jgi:hypothetical protein
MTDQILQKEAYDSYRFLIDHTNFREGSKAYGLTLDRSSKKLMATVAGSGFMLSALPIGVARGWDSYETNLKRARLTLVNFYENVPQYEGMFVHYVNYETGERHKKCEYSTIDTTLFLNGVMVVDSFFDDSLVREYAQKIFERVNWNHFIFERFGRQVFHMAYNDIQGGDYLAKGQLGWIHHWSMMAEQLPMYVLAAGSDAIPSKLAKQLFLGFDRSVGGYKGYQFVFTPLGTIFPYLFSNAWFDFRKYLDMKGYDWFENAEKAVMADYEYCQGQKVSYKTFDTYLWGLSSCDGPHGYAGYGAPPFGTFEDVDASFLIKRTDGTVALYAMLSSLPFQPDLVKSSVAKLVKVHPDLIGDYGFYDSINLENGKWIGKDYISIDKGITLLMIDNYYHGTVWDLYMKNALIQKAVEKLAFIKKEG